MKHVHSKAVTTLVKRPQTERNLDLLQPARIWALKWGQQQFLQLSSKVEPFLTQAAAWLDLRRVALSRRNRSWWAISCIRPFTGHAGKGGIFRLDRCLQGPSLAPGRSLREQDRRSCMAALGFEGTLVIPMSA